MDWILQHLWVAVVIAGLVVKVLQAVRGTKPAAGKGGSEGKTFDDPELAERTRKIREEIQRKIEERRGQSGRPAVSTPAQPKLRLEERSAQATPPPVIELPAMIREVLRPRSPPAPAPAPTESAAAAELARQADLAEELRQIVAMKSAVEQRAAFASSFADREQAARVTRRDALLDDLRNPDSLRRALVLREVLGPPVALRNS